MSDTDGSAKVTAHAQTLYKSLEQKLHEELAEARLQYCLQLPLLWAELVTVLIGAHNDNEEAAFQTAAQLAHRLCGNSGAYGYKRISAVAREVEDLVLAVLESQDCDGRESWSSIKNALDRGQILVSCNNARTPPESVGEIEPKA